MTEVLILEYDKKRSKFLTDYWFKGPCVPKIIRRHEGEAYDWRIVRSCDLLILSGGGWGPYDDKVFLAEDKEMLVRLRAEGSGPKVLGICLGAQLMTVAFGGEVHCGGSLALGWNHVEINVSHPVFKGIDSLLQVEIHSNHITKLPDEARLLASSALDRVEVFQVGDRFLGTAYHPEITPDDIEWFRADQRLDISRIISTTSHALSEARAASETFFANLKEWARS